MTPNQVRPEASDSVPPSSVATSQQALLYAADLSELYDRVCQDQARLAKLEGRLQDLARISVSLVEAASAEAAAQRLANELSATLMSKRTSVFLLRTGRYRLLASVGDPPSRSSFTREDAHDVEKAPSGLGLGNSAFVLGLPGRGGGMVGFAALETTPTADSQGVVDLLARFAGLVLESHLIEETRSEAHRAIVSPQVSTAESPSAVLGDSEPMKQVRKLVSQVASAKSPVLVLGKTGTGKELVARAIHDASPRRKGPFVALNCGAFPEGLVESEIFGHEVGAFTGAQKKHRGKVELAQGGTLFLDELGEMPKNVQVKLLRFLQDSKFIPLGGETERTADVRIVAATNRNLEAAIAAGDFREDLSFRLNVFTIEMPRLAERGHDVISLARVFAREVAAQLGRPVPELTAEGEKALRAYDWPGNVRELRNVIERAVILSDGDVIDLAQLPRAKTLAREDPKVASAAVPSQDAALALVPAPSPSRQRDTEKADVFAFVGDVVTPFAVARDEILARFEARYCQAILARAAGNVSKAARLAKMNRRSLHRKINDYGLTSTEE